MNVVLKEILLGHMNDIETLREIRNECRTFMTRNTDEISAEQQRLWYMDLDKTKNKLYILHNVIHGVIVEPIGYGYLRIEDGAVLLTGGLIQRERGKGYGGVLFNHLLQNAKEFELPIKLEVLSRNTAAFKIYSSLGFRVVKTGDQIMKMEYIYDSVI